MDQINESKYPSPPMNYSMSSSLFTVGVILCMCAPVNFIFMRSAEQAMILMAYGFFFFLGSGLMSLCSPYELD
jgi:hypothetical protein